MPASTFTIRFVDVNGDESSKSVAQGTTVGDLIDTDDYTAILNGDQVGADVQLRSGDVLEESRKAGKAG